MNDDKIKCTNCKSFRASESFETNPKLNLKYKTCKRCRTNQQAIKDERRNRQQRGKQEQQDKINRLEKDISEQNKRISTLEEENAYFAQVVAQINDDKMDLMDENRYFKTFESRNAELIKQIEGLKVDIEALKLNQKISLDKDLFTQFANEFRAELKQKRKK